MMIITIDGPAGAGKSTIAKKLALKTGYKYVDTGAMYRAVTLKVIETAVDFNDTLAVEKTAEDLQMTIDYEGNTMKVMLDGEDISEKIRTEKVTENTSRIAAVPGVRYKLAKIQRQAAEKFSDVVFEGRDMGSIVFPNADLKIYLSAGIDERARRRWEELKGRGIETDLDDLKEKIRIRDKRDESRGLAPLRVPENAKIIDSTEMSIDEVVEKIIALLAW